MLSTVVIMKDSIVPMSKVTDASDIDGPSTSESRTTPLFMVSDRLKINNFDGLRLIFASMVLVFHVALLSQSPQLSILYRYISSAFAVQSFFFVSGFLVVMSYDNTLSIISYFIKRFFRIFPAYAVVIILCAFFLYLSSIYSFESYFSHPEWRSYIISNLMLSNFKQPTLPGVFMENFEPAVNGSLWTIKLEVMFYCLVPFIVWLVRKIGYKPVLALLFACSILWAAGFTYAAHYMNPDLALRLAKQLPGQLGFFAGGALAYYRTRDGLPPPPAWMAIIGVVLYAMTSGLVFTILAPIAVTLTTYWAAIKIPQIWSAKRWGDFSYGIYLFHFPIAQVLIANGAFDDRPVLSLLAVYALALVAAITSWHIVEKPCLQFVHRRRTLRQAV